MKKQLLLKSVVLVFFLLCGSYYSGEIYAQMPGVQQKRTVQGKITDASGSEVIGANVRVKATSNGATSDVSGNFSLNVSDNDVLVISFLGYKTKEVPVAGKSSINIQLEEDA
ncbi:MAG: carboxypeptidase-like regulatory domain-containing protein, partial [Candidatus Symbiothrix sp.]|nr:carboxypeptidase-like regulatory domain-containing protein [Candidatus Symbiothrix sp.]